MAASMASSGPSGAGNEDDGMFWEQRQDVNTGRLCYYNTRTHDCQWDKPQSMTNYEKRLTSMAWEQCFDLSGRMYYHNSVTTVAQYDRPIELGPSPNSPWSVHRAATGETYFYNAVTGSATFQKPGDF